MKINVDVQMNLRTAEVGRKVQQAVVAGLKDTIVGLAGDVIRGSPKLTGNNMRSIAYEAKGLEAKVFSTSGYGGYLETGTGKMAARPYFRPAMDKNLPNLWKRIRDYVGAG